MQNMPLNAKRQNVTDRQTDRQMYGWMDRRTDGWDRQCFNEPIYRKHVKNIDIGSMSNNRFKDINGNVPHYETTNIPTNL